MPFRLVSAYKHIPVSFTHPLTPTSWCWNSDRYADTPTRFLGPRLPSKPDSSAEKLMFSDVCFLSTAAGVSLSLSPKTFGRKASRPSQTS